MTTGAFTPIEPSSERDATVAKMREKYIAANPDPQDRKARLIQEFEADLARNAPWLPGGQFIANPGLGGYILACLRAWEPEADVNQPDTELISLFSALIAFLRANEEKPEATARLLRAVATDLERERS